MGTSIRPEATCRHVWPSATPLAPRWISSRSSSACHQPAVGACCWRPGVAIRPLPPPRPGHWFDPSAIPLERQREIAEAYRAFPGYEVAAAYGIALPWVQKIARLHGVRKAAPRGYRKQRQNPARAQPPTPAPVQCYLATLVVEAQLEASSWEAAVASLRQAGSAIHVVRVCTVQRLVATEPDTRQT